MGAIIPSSQGGVSCEKSNNFLPRGGVVEKRWKKKEIGKSVEKIHPRQRGEYEIRSPQVDEEKGRRGE